MTDSKNSLLNGHSTGVTRGEGAVLAACLVLLAGFLSLESRMRYDPPPDFATLSVEERKREFFAYLSPMITELNFEFAADRDRVRELRARFDRDKELGWFDRRWLARLAARLEVDLDEMDTPTALDVLERRAGIVPESLVLVQAAVESGWGTSRFAREGNNYFGQRCYTSNCGMVPEQRPDDARFGLARFVSAAASIESYMLNLNTHQNYRGFRELREQRRDAGEPVTGLSLVEGLSSYSVRGREYVTQLVSMIRDNGLE